MHKLNNIYGGKTNERWKIVELSEEELESLCACGCSCAKAFSAGMGAGEAESEE